LLQTLRIRWHYLAKRGEDRLLFDFQTPLRRTNEYHARQPTGAPANI